MRIASSFSVESPADGAAEQAVAALIDKLSGQPDLLVVYATEHHAQPGLIAALRARAPEARIIGATSCGGVMTEAGFHAGPHGALGLLGVHDPDGAYGVAARPLQDDAFAAGAAAIEAAVADAGRDYEAPVLVWCTQP